MAKFDSYLLGNVTKTLGNVTMCYMNKQNIARARIFSRKDKPTSDVLDQRARMKVLIELSRFLLPVVQKGFVGIGNGTTSNAFVAKNMKSVDVDEMHTATVDYERLKVAMGLQDIPEVSVSYSSESKMYSFEQEMLEEENGFALADDLVYAVLFESVLMRVKLISLRSRGENGNTSVGLPKNWEQANVKVYCFATSKNGKSISPSLYLAVE